MTTTNELPPPNLEQKIDTLIELVNSFRSSLMERMDQVEEDSRLRYVDLRQRIDESETRLTERINKLEEKLDRQDKRQDRMEQRLYTLDKNIDAFVREMLYVKDRVNEMEATRELRH